MRTFATLTITLMSFFAFSQQKPPFIPRPVVSYFFNGKCVDDVRATSKSDTLLEVKAILKGEQKQKMPDVTFLITEVEVSLIRDEKKIAGLVILDGKGSIAPLLMLAAVGDQYQLTVKGIKFLYDGVYHDIGTGDVIRNYFLD
jgi:hypothetical protein